MSDNNQAETLAKFTNVTGVAEDRAKFYLESASWNLQVSEILCVSVYDFVQKVQVSVFVWMSSIIQFFFFARKFFNWW